MEDNDDDIYDYYDRIRNTEGITTFYNEPVATVFAIDIQRSSETDLIIKQLHIIVQAIIDLMRNRAAISSKNQYCVIIYNTVS